MLGWEVTITRQNPSVNLEESTLASWITGWNGLNWLDGLIEKGVAQPFGAREFGHKRYAAPVGSVFEALSLWNPDRSKWDVIGDDYAIPKGWMGDIKFFADRLKSCPSDEMVLITAVDQS